MYSPNALAKIESPRATPHLWPSAFPAGSIMQLSTAEDEAEALSFLAARPVHTVNLRGFIRDNGLCSSFNRGKFYGYRNGEGKLEGVALIGHATLIEAHTDRALEALARKAQECTRAHMIMGEQERIEEFWSYYAEDGQRMRLACRELMFELRWPVEARQTVSGLRLATLDDLDLIIPAQAAMAEEESGINPLEKDPEGFRTRCARRIEQGRTWVCVENGRLIFKTDVMADTPEVIYLEGIYVSPLERSKGYGLRCLSQLSRTLLRRTASLSILVNEQNVAAQALYKRAGFKFTSTYDTIFLQQN
jgi:predicted GNAT family acetyltransferase